MQTKLFWPFFPKRQNSNGRSLLSEKTLLLYSSEAIDQAIKNRPGELEAFLRDDEAQKPCCLGFYLEKKTYVRFLNIEYCGLSFGVFSLFFGRATVLAVKPLSFFFFLYITGGIAGHWGEKRPKSFKITRTGASPFLTKKKLFPVVEVSRIEKTQSPKPKSYFRIKAFSRCPLFLVLFLYRNWKRNNAQRSMQRR